MDMREHTHYIPTRADITPETQVDTGKRLRNVTMGANEMTHEETTNTKPESCL